jgi:hypothetical protein
MKYAREQYILERLIEKANLRTLLKDVSYFIAGGALTSVFSGKQVNDLDIYFYSVEDFNKADSQLTISPIFRTDNAFSFKNNNVKVQYIKKIFGKMKN